MTRVRMNRRRGDFDHLWLLTFADLMVQLMVFFVLAWSMKGDGKRDQLNELIRSLQKALRANPQTVQTDPKGPPPMEGILDGLKGIDPSRAADLEKLMTDLQATDGPEEGRRLRLVSFRGSLLFREGSATVDPVFLPLMERMAALTKEYPGFQLVCQGHAAPDEKGKGGADPLELSAQRAAAAVRFLASRDIDPRTLTIEARGDSEVDGDPRSPEGRALNRQVKFRFQRFAER